MARSLLNHSVLTALGLWITGAIGCAAGHAPGGVGGSGGYGTGGVGTTTSTSSATSTVGSTSSAGTVGAGSSVSTSTTAGPGGAGGSGATSGIGGATGSTAGSSTAGSGGDPNDEDRDGDGWSANEGDCCDTPGSCDTPALVNPGAFEYLGNGVDDDCDPSTRDNIIPDDCSPPALTVPTGSDDLIKAMDLCQVTTESPTKALKKWGVIQTSLLLADGTTAAAPKDLQVGVLGMYGANVFPRKNGTMAALSSGTARAVGDPGHVHPQNGALAGQVGNFDAGTQVSVPPSWLAAHNGVVPSPGSCPVCNGAVCAKAFDSVNLKARIRVPTNAKSFSYSLKFYTAEYPEFVCQRFNDFFITLLKSQWAPNLQPGACTSGSECESGTCTALKCDVAAALPADRNIALDGQKNAVSVNNGFFEVCFAAANAPPGACPSGTSDLVGTGMGGWTSGSPLKENLRDGGGTEWLKNDSPVVPGETIDIEFIIWDAGDHNVDSLVLLDRFRWNVTPSAVGVHK